MAAHFTELKGRNLVMSLVLGPKNMYPFEINGALQAHLSKTSCFDFVILSRKKKLECICLELAFQGN